ncbi:MAG: hypothetical protein MJE77_07275 [Proteobacteria bacterium]|nr:hypothetical protein [Pseudomonadota bacterium]
MVTKQTIVQARILCSIGVFIAAAAVALTQAGCGSNSDLNCGTASTVCGESCVDLEANSRHCGACGNACESGQVCSAGQCVASCPAPFTDCSGACVYTAIDPDHCGGCAQACERFPQSLAGCVASRCFEAGCEEGFDDCNDNLAADGCEINLASNAAHCGQCGNACFFAEACSSSTCAEDAALAARHALRITTMQAAQAQCSAVDHATISGNDRGGIAVSGNFFYYMGDTSGVKFALTDLSAVAVTRQDSIFSDLSSGQLYAFTVDGTAQSPACGSTIEQIDGIVALDPDDLSPVGAVIALSSTIPWTCEEISNGGVFSGRGVVVLHDESRTSYAITLPEAQVVALGSAVDLSDARTCENWALWGVAEYVSGDLHLVYRSDSPTAIVRQSVRTGAVATVLDLTDIDVRDMCSITVDLAGNRWLWHYQGSGDLDGGGNTETAGACPATF